MKLLWLNIIVSAIASRHGSPAVLVLRGRQRLRRLAAVHDALRLVSAAEKVIRGHAPAPRDAPATWADVPPTTPETVSLARELKRRGFRFVGPTTLYALMQACGLVDDHLAGCPARPAVERARRAAGLP